MQIKFIGTGGAFDFSKGNASAIVEVAGHTILVDCGFTTLSALAKHDIINNIDYILVTHLHGDHVGSLPTLLAYFEHRLQRTPPKIIVPNKAFQHDLTTFLNLTQELKRAEFLPIEQFPNIGFVDTTGSHVPEMPTFGYYFTENDHLIYYSGDTGDVHRAKEFLTTRTESKVQVFHETTFMQKGTAHVYYDVLQTELADYEVYAYHIAKENKPADCTLNLVEEFPEFVL